jgi:hypothetical protein
MPADDKWQTYDERLWTTAEVKMVPQVEEQWEPYDEALWELSSYNTVKIDIPLQRPESDECHPDVENNVAMVIEEEDSVETVSSPSIIKKRKSFLKSIGRRLMSVVCTKLCCCGCKEKN